MGTGEAAFARIARASHNRVQHLHQSRPIILYDIYLRPNGSNSSIEARPMIDIATRAFSLEMHPFEYGPVKYGITIKRGFQKQPKALSGNVDSDRAFRASVVAKVASDRRIGFIEPRMTDPSYRQERKRLKEGLRKAGMPD